MKHELTNTIRTQLRRAVQGQLQIWDATTAVENELGVELDCGQAVELAATHVSTGGEVDDELLNTLWEDLLERNDKSIKLQTAIHDTPLSTRAKNALVSENITSVHALAQKTRADIRAIRNVGDGTVHEISNYLVSLGLKFQGE